MMWLVCACAMQLLVYLTDLYNNIIEYICGITIHRLLSPNYYINPRIMVDYTIIVGIKILLNIIDGIKLKT